MNVHHKKHLTSIMFAYLACMMLFSIAQAKTVTPGYNTEIPAKIMTPDKVDSKIGNLEFIDGRPTKSTVEAVYDNLDLMRGVETFLNGIPAASVEAIRRGMVTLGVDSSNKALIFDHLMDSNPLFLTGNTDTVYLSVILNLKKDGPTVVEIPAKCGPGTVNDAFFRFVTDMGLPGPDRGAGGKYLILPPDYKGELNPTVGKEKTNIGGVDYYISKSTSYVNWLILRGFLVDAKPDASTAMFKEDLKVYPFAKINNPPKMKFISGSDKSFNTVHANTFEFYEELHSVIEREPISMLDPELRGLFASIGIQKNKPFAPDTRMKKILTEAVAIGNATARTLIFEPRLEDVYKYPNSFWATAFVGGDYKWLKDGGNGGRYLDARTLFFYQATVNTPAMTWKLIGKGSQYAYAAKDHTGDYLDGSKTYKLNIPANVPAARFWSIVVYDPQTRSELQTTHKFPSKNNKRDDLVYNDDGSADLYFGPKAPVGKKPNWIETVPSKGWYTILRLYGPLDSWFDKTWRPGEIVLVK